MVIAIGTLIVDSIIKTGWVSAELWGLTFFITYLLYTVITFDRVYQFICIFAIAAGFVELIADHYLVVYTGTLVYPHQEPFIWTSPFYMPFSWAVVIIQIGYFGWLISKRTGPVISGLILVVASGLIIPLYESWAIKGGWWHYHHCPNWNGVPYYIFIAEGLLMFTVPWFLNKAEGKKVKIVLGYGMLEGLVMLLACIIAILITQWHVF